MNICPSTKTQLRLFCNSQYQALSSNLTKLEEKVNLRTFQTFPPKPIPILGLSYRSRIQSMRWDGWGGGWRTMCSLVLGAHRLFLRSLLSLPVWSLQVQLLPASHLLSRDTGVLQG